MTSRPSSGGVPLPIRDFTPDRGDVAIVYHHYQMSFLGNLTDTRFHAKMRHCEGMLMEANNRVLPGTAIDTRLGIIFQ